MNSYDQDTPHTPATWLAGALVFVVGPIAAAWSAARRLTRPRRTWGRFTPTASDGHGDTHLIAAIEDAFNEPLPTPRPGDAARFAAYGQDAVDAEFAAITEQWIDLHFATDNPLDEEHRP